jgi:hypothetical protein
VTQLPETLGLDHAQETFNFTIDNQSVSVARSDEFARA